MTCFHGFIVYKPFMLIGVNIFNKAIILKEHIKSGNNVTNCTAIFFVHVSAVGAYYGLTR